MRHISRLEKPRILAEKAEQWTSIFASGTKNRPDNSKYAHAEVKGVLYSMSFHKCYYCERKLKNIPKEIDHFIEVSERKDLAYEWENLYLACDNCNGKIPNTSIAVTDVLDPCRHTDDEIGEHLVFDDELITAKNGSALGLKTIQKYGLDSEQLDHLRVRQLKVFQKLYITILQNMHSEGRGMNDDEKAQLLQFQQADMSFSLMFRQLIRKVKPT